MKFLLVSNSKKAYQLAPRHSLSLPAYLLFSLFLPLHRGFRQHLGENIFLSYSSFFLCLCINNKTNSFIFDTLSVLALLK